MIQPIYFADDIVIWEIVLVLSSSECLHGASLYVLPVSVCLASAITSFLPTP